MTISKTIFQSVYDELVYKGVVKTQSDISSMLGITTSYTSKLLKSEEILPASIREKLVEKFGIDKEWLSSGGKENAMFSADMTIKKGKSKEVIPLGKHIPLRLKPEEYAEAFGDWKGLPMYNVPITASFVATYRDEKATPPYYYLHDPRFRDCDFGAVITGDSMHSEIRHGDMVACKEVTDWRFVVFGDIYYIVGTNGLETCKYLHPDREDRNNFLLVPRNESIPPSPLPKDMILKMYKVRGIIRGY